MPNANTVILWALTVGSVALLVLGIVFVATIIFNQKKVVTIERQKLEALKEREQRFRSLIENSFDAVALMDVQGTITYASQSTNRVLGYSAEELVGMPASKFLHHDGLKDLQRVFENDVNVPGSRVEMQIRSLHKDGSWRWLDAVATNLLTEHSVNAIVFNYRDITERKEAEEHLKHSRDQLRMLSARLQSVREEERTRIAREIHDELGQMLTALKMDLALLERKLNERGNQSKSIHVYEMKSIFELIDLTIQSVRRIATELRPQLLDELGLDEAIEWEMQMFQARTGISCVFLSSVGALNLRKDYATALFRIVQETLTNVYLHSRATEVTASMDIHEGTLLLQIKDNGFGIPEQKIEDFKSLGILGMKERVLFMGGKFLLKGEEGKGTVLSVHVPLTTSSLVDLN